MNTHHTLLLFFAALSLWLTSCQDAPQTTSDKIDALKQQVETDAQTLQDLENKDYATLQSDFRYCDSMLQYLSEEQVDAGFEKLNLAQAYLLQFNEVKPRMVSKIDYVIVQLDRLKADLASQYLNDSLALTYLNDERLVADTLHQQLLYFQDRFRKSQLNALRKSWK